MKQVLKKWSSIIFVLTTLLATSANAEIIDFEDFDAGTIIDNEYQLSHGVTIKGVNQSYGIYDDNIGVIFDTNNYTGGDSDLASPFTNSAGEKYNPGNVLIIHEHPDECDQFTCGSDPDDEGSRPAGYFDIVFSQAVTLNSIDFFDIEYAESNQPKYEIELFSDAQFNDNLQDNLFFMPATGDRGWEKSVFAVDNVMAIRINLGGSGAIDNINYSVTEVPEPAAWVLLSACAFGLVRRLRRA
ncbi:MAG: thrombospondin type 3 repeat:Cna B-type [Gammaproteobacteria bacterium]|nr:thrombospondin type 3 repeat:Cna B-type [Gammaproteobacteria bacterium]